ncbi:hypothetical protein RRG08_059378 [Elysia crispata]|uniref:Uncharacterized protein n=1 Tax=Elysia crispata TaxID=231223 RepID=A0AAE1BE25_9GAST|nr:hypothetical protein RRG08_059378 [Elysia crispata]
MLEAPALCDSFTSCLFTLEARAAAVYERSLFRPGWPASVDGAADTAAAGFGYSSHHIMSTTAALNSKVSVCYTVPQSLRNLRYVVEWLCNR